MPEVGGVFGLSYPKENLAAVHEDIQTFAMDVVVSWPSSTSGHPSYFVH